MKNNGYCPDCPVMLRLESIMEGNIQVYTCPDCKQVYYREFRSKEIFKTLEECMG
jgi:transposase-like protein